MTKQGNSFLSQIHWDKRRNSNTMRRTGLEKQTFADGQEIGYTYNEDGSLTSITPPGRPAHTINYTSRNQFASYTPPAVDGVVNSSELIYDADRRIIRSAAA